MWPTIADALTHKIDGDEYNLNWVDWNNDRHQDGWLGYMNLGVDSWRNHLEGRIADMIERYKVDAYFLDIAGGHVNSTNGDMHEGTKRLVMNLKIEVSERARRRRDALRRAAPVPARVSRRRRRRVAEVQSLLLAPERAGARTREQRRARVRVWSVQHRDAGTLAERDSHAAGGRRHVHRAPRHDGGGDRAGQAAGGHRVTAGDMVSDHELIP